MFSIRHYVILVVLIFLGKVALAGVLIEPYVGYSMLGKMTKTESSVERSYNYSGLNFGGRLGAQYLGLMGGLIYDHGSYTATFKKPLNLMPSDGDESKWSANSYGLFVGYNLPILLRFWGSYFFKSDWEATDTQGGYNKNDTLNGSAYELGVGYTALPFLSLNLQYRVTDFDKIERATGTKTNLNDTNAKSLLLSVSLPINL